MPIHELFLAGGCLAVLLVYLGIERIFLNKRVRRLPLRICVTGTRGKSSVTRLVAASLSEAGWSVLAKTTGSSPSLILPDGSEQEIQRRYRPTPLEGRKVLKAADKLHVQAVVLELMSLHPESLFVESVRMFCPHILLVTNVRVDHVNQMGTSREEIASSLASAVPEGGTVFIPEKEFFPVFQQRAKFRDSNLVQVPEDTADGDIAIAVGKQASEFEDDIRMTLAITDFLKIGRETALRGMCGVRPDLGSLKLWKAELGEPPRPWLLVSAFAANDPESSRLVLEILKEHRFLEGKRALGLLNLRADRADRSLQWLNILKTGAFSEFHKLVVLGEHAPVLKRKLKPSQGQKVVAVRRRPAESLMADLAREEQEGAVLIGMGNIGGAGLDFLKLWERTGVRCGF